MQSFLLDYKSCNETKMYLNTDFCFVLFLLDSTYNGADVHLNAGEHKFPFSFQLPSCGLPHAFEGKYGYVRYKVMAIIDRPWKFNHETQRLFSVVGIGLDLNSMPQLATVRVIIISDHSYNWHIHIEDGVTSN